MAEAEQLSVPRVHDAPPAAATIDVSDEVITRWIVENPDRPGADDVRVSGFGVPVWALIGHAHATGAGASEIAGDYELPAEAVVAALAYYERHRPLIDERLAANSTPA